MNAARFGPSVALLLVACGQNSEEPSDWPSDRRWESEHFRYHTRAEDSSACEAVLAQLEHHFTLLRNYLGFAWPAGRKIDYYKFADRNDFRRSAGCPEGAGSCTRDSMVRSPEFLQHHELVHAYLAPTGLPPAFFTEGLATALSCGKGFRVGSRPWEDVVARPFGDPRVFVEGPWFLGNLLRRYGPAPVLELYSSLDYRWSDAAQIAATYEQIFGETLDEAWAEARSSGDVVPCVYLWECSGEEFALDGSKTKLGVACDGSDQFRHFELPAETDLFVNAGGQLVDAPTSCEHALSIGPEESSPLSALAHFPAGRYFLGRQDLPLEVGVRALGASMSTDCEAVEAIELRASEIAHDYFEVTIPNDGSPWYARFAADPERRLCNAAAATGSVELCSSCGDAACAPFDCLAASPEPNQALLRFTPFGSSAAHASLRFYWAR